MSLQAQNWDSFLILGLQMLDCHVKGPKMLQFTIFRGKFQSVRKYAGVKDSTNIISDDD